MTVNTMLSAAALCTLLTTGAFAAGEVTSPKLNPQPEPPAPMDTLKNKKKLTSPVTAKGINPQPEPPKAKKIGKPKPGEKVGLNPQPEPPAKAPRTLKPGEAQGFNPQPEPPGKTAK